MPSWWFDSTLRTQYRRISPNYLIVDGERTGRRILALFLVIALISALPVFSFADGEEFVLKDSGSPMVSMMAMRAIAANDGISLAAAEGNSGQFGYDIQPYDGNLNFEDYGFGSSSTRVYYSYYITLPAGQYVVEFGLSEELTNAGASYYSGGSGTILVSKSLESSSASLVLNLPSPGRVEVWGSKTGGFSSAVSSINFKVSTLKPVEGISCGWSVSQAFSETNRRDAFEDFIWDFGVQPAGNYVLNIYHYGIAYTCDWHIAYGSSPVGENSRFIPVSNANGVSTAIVSHGGGNLILSGEVIFAHPYGDGYFDGTGTYSEYGGSGSISLDIFQRDNWSYAVSDVIIVPLAGAGLEQFGVFGPLIGFLRDGFSSIKSNVITQFSQLKTHLTTEFTNLKSSITTQFTQLKTLITNQFTRLIDFLNDQYSGAVSSELSQDMNSAESMIEQENQFTDSINTQITEQSSKVDPVTVLDGIEGSSNVFSSMLWVSSIVSSGINGMGVFQFLIYVPMILGIVTLVIGRGVSIAGRRPRPQPVNVRKGK